MTQSTATKEFEDNDDIPEEWLGPLNSTESAVAAEPSTLQAPPGSEKWSWWDTDDGHNQNLADSVHEEWTWWDTPASPTSQVDSPWWVSDRAADSEASSGTPRRSGVAVEASLADPETAHVSTVAAPVATELLHDGKALPLEKDHHYAEPPTDNEKYHYIRGPQHRWFWWAHLLSFAGIFYSLYGFARTEYWTLIALVPLALFTGETLLGLRTSTFRRNVTLSDHQFLVETWNPTSYPSVDVFLPTAGEGLELLENTYHYVAQLVWPGDLRVHVLDDMDREEVRASASSHGFNYLARPGSEFKKAGNLRYAFDRTYGDHIFILDADFVPRPDALLELVPYFDQEEVGIVQSPQYFATPKSMNWLQRGAGATQEIFYRFIQVSRDSVNAAICCGTSALYRRSALERIGGFPKIGHSEDVFTGFEMDKYGYRLQYVPVNVTQGICPDEINGFITQQYRWCEGSAELVATEDFHTHPSLTNKMRLSFWSGFFYYGTTAMNAFFAPLPVLIMIWVFPQYLRASNFVPLVGLFLLWLVVYPALLKTRWRLQTLRVQTIYSFTHAVAIFDVFLSGKTAEWVPSHGAEGTTTPLAVKVRRLMVVYLSASMLLVTVGLVYRLWSPAFGINQWWPALLFIAANFYVFVPVIWLALGKSARTRPSAVPSMAPQHVAAP